MRRVALAAVLAAALAWAHALRAEELWPPAVEAFNAGDFARAIATLDQLLPLIVEGSELSLHAEHVWRVRRAAQLRLEQQLAAASAGAWAAVPEVGALEGPPAHTPPAPRASAAPCGEASGACADAATDALAPPAAVVEAAAACGPGAGEPAAAAAASTYGVCAFAADGTNAELYQWVHAQLCAGAAVVDVTDARADSAAPERQLARWMLEPLLEQGRVVLTELPARAAAAAEPPPVCAAAEPVWAYGGADSGWLLALRARERDARADEREQAWRACVARHEALDWVALVRAPDESLLPARTAPAERGAPPLDVGAALASASRALGARDDRAGEAVGAEGGAPEAAAAPVAAWLPWLELGEFGGTAAAAAAVAAGAVAHRPARPALATHVHRRGTWAACTPPAGAPGAPGARACAAADDGLLVVRPRRWLAVDARRAALVLLLSPDGAGGALRAARTLRARARGAGRGGGALDTVDWVGRWHQQACDAAAHDVAAGAPLPLADARADEASRAPWVADALAKLTGGDGFVVVRGGVEASTAQALPSIRARFLGSLPEQRTRGVSQGFGNAMCQAVRGAPTTAGYAAGCEPLHPQLLALAHEPSVLALARALLGDDCVLHNAGISLVGARSRRAHDVGAHQDQPLPTGAPRAWRGRVPPPSHPLSLQALWPLDAFEFENGPTFVVPRSHHRAERLDSWLDNGTDVVGGGLWPARFVLAEPGDVAFVLGSTWHGASSHVRASARARAAARVALLYEYAPGFVEPLHRYPPALIERAVPAALRPLFPLVDLAAGGAAGGAAARPAERGCADGGVELVAVWDWPREMRARPGCARASTRVLLRAGRGAIPALGLSVDGAPPEQLARAVRGGARLLETEAACRALDEPDAGPLAPVAAAVAQPGGPHREGLFLAHRLGHWCAQPAAARACACVGSADALDAAVRAALEPLGAGGYLDLALLGGEAAPGAPADGAAELVDEAARAAARVEAWRGMLALRARGLVRALGVVDWTVAELEAVRAATGELPDVLQAELHPLRQRAELRAYAERHGILVQARGHHSEAVVTHPALLDLAARAPELGRMVASPAAIVAMRWSLQAGAALVTRARGVEELAADQLVFWAGFRDLLTPALMADALITQLDQ